MIIVPLVPLLMVLALFIFAMLGANIVPLLTIVLSIIAVLSFILTIVFSCCAVKDDDDEDKQACIKLAVGCTIVFIVSVILLFSIYGKKIHGYDILTWILNL